MNFPDDLLYTSDHEWVIVEGNTATVGITDFAQSELGDIVYVEIETEGETMDNDDVFGSVEAVKTVSDLYLPLPGTISEVNPGLEDNPELVNSDPYGKGWMIKITIEEGTDTSHLLSPSDYQSQIGQA